MTAATYDGNGLRASTTITPAGGSAITQGYVWNAQLLLMDGANAYIYATGPAPAEQVNLASGAITYLIADTLGSVRGTVSSAGVLTATTAYDAWGNPETSGGLTAQTPFGFAGGYTDPSGLVYLINRYYSPQLGQFTSVDPELASTLQPYAYAGDNPVSDTDPDGLATYKAVEYKPQCASAGCVNIIKMCTKNLKNCMLFWNTEASKTYKPAVSAYLYVTIYVQGRLVTAYKYDKMKNANQKLFFHGQWGAGNPMGKYTYGCDGFFECTGYLKASDDVAFGNGNPNGGWLFKGRHQIVTIFGYWGVNKGRIVDWTGGGQRYAGLSH
jgi:RHS repeat-associated protein